MTLALDAFDLGSDHEQLVAAMRRSMCCWLFISFSSDWLFPAYQTLELVDAAIATDKRVSYCNIKSYCGHDAFLLENEAPMYGGLTNSFLHNLSLDWQPDDKERRQALNESYGKAPVELKTRVDYDRILELIPPKTKILDLGCGRGDLLAHLKARGHERLVGVEIEEELVLKCVEKGIDALQLDMNDGLKYFSDHQFDFVVLSKTLQTIKNVEIVLRKCFALLHERS